MKVRQQRKNLRAVRKMTKLLAQDYRIKTKWEIDEKRSLIYVDFIIKLSRKCKYTLVTSLKEDKVAYGKYKPSMIEYNMRRQIEKWLSEIYNEKYKELSGAD